MPSSGSLPRMVEEFIEHYARMVASHPEMIRVERYDVDEGFCEVAIYANRSDAGKLIGKEGNMISAIKTVVSGCKAKDGRSYRVLVKPVD